MSDVPDIDNFRIKDNSVVASICDFFNLPLPAEDRYQYAQESSSVTLLQAETALHSAGSGYHYFHGRDVVAIKASDIEAYINIFKSSSDTENALSSFLSNAKKESPRKSAASHLMARRLRPESCVLTKRKNHGNPYFDLWAQCCHDLGFLGPLDIPSYYDPALSRQSHPILPVFMHHFGCAIPSYEALLCIKTVAGARTVLDVGCGNGYWTHLLRRMNVPVVPVDDCSSSWRTRWIDDTIKMDAVKFLRTRETKDEVLVLIYPIAGQHLTQRILEAYRGNTVIMVGTQNRNRYTAFTDTTVEEYFAARDAWHVTVRIAIPSFPGKDDALYVIQRQ